MEQALALIAQYLLYGILILAVTFLINLGMSIYALIQLQRDNREIIREVSNLGAMTQNVAAMTREVLRRTAE